MPAPTLIRFARDSSPCAIDNIGMDYIGMDIEGVVTGGNDNFCSVPLSAYRSGAFNNIWQFKITYTDGIVQPVYCLEKGVRNPQGNPYRSMPIQLCLPNLTSAQIAQLNWILANGYPAISAAQLFTCAGVDASLSPALTEDDAYAAVQIALWSAIDPPADRATGWRFYECVSGALHIKSARLQQTVAYLYDSAIARGQGPDATLSGSTTDIGSYEIESGCRVAHIGNATLTDCGSDEMTSACGKVLYGPLMVHSNAPFSLELKPLCAQQSAPGFITLVNGCGDPIQSPNSGQEFYISFPPKTCASCYELSLLVKRTVVTVAIMCPIDPTIRLQAIGAVPNTSTRYDRASLCLCYAPPCRICAQCLNNPNAEKCLLCPSNPCESSANSAPNLSNFRISIADPCSTNTCHAIDDLPCPCFQGACTSDSIARRNTFQ